MRKIIFFCLLSIFIWANGPHQNIIKLEEEKFEIIDLNQKNSPKNTEQSFDSSTLLNKKAVVSKDTKQDFVLLASLNPTFSFKINDFSVPKRQFASDIFKALLAQIAAKKSLSLLSPAQNINYETRANYHYFNGGSKREIFGVSGLLSDESGFKRADYILFLALDSFKIANEKTFFFYNQNTAYVSVPFRVLDIKSKKLISKTINLKFALSKNELKEPKKAYQASVERISALLFDFLNTKNLLQF